MESYNLVEFEERTDVYDTFSHLAKREEVLSYLKDLYTTNALQERPQLQELLKELDVLPDYLLLYLVVEIQLMQKEQGCWKYEERQPGCLHAFFAALKLAFTIAIDTGGKVKASHQLFKTVHRILTDPEQVKDERLTSDSGEYRANNDEALSLPTSEASDAGVTYLITCMLDKTFNSMVIGGSKDLKTVKLAERKIDAIIQVNQVLERLANVPTVQAEQKILELVNGIEAQKLNTSFKHAGVNDLLLSILTRAIKEGPPHFANLAERISSKQPIDWLSELQQLAQTKSGLLIIQELLDALSSEKLKTMSILEQTKKYLISGATIEQAMEVFEATDIEDLAFKLMVHIESKDQEFTIQFVDAEEAKLLMEKYITEFNEQFDSMLDEPDDKKFRFLYGFIQKSLLIHPFFDANNRTFVNVLGLVWHAELKLPSLPIYYNPFVFYAHTLDEIVHATKLACANLLAIKEAVSKQGSKYFSLLKSLNPEEREQIKKFVQPFRDLIEKIKINDLIAVINVQLKDLSGSTSGTLQFFDRPQLDSQIKKDIEAISQLNKFEDCLNFLRARMDKSPKDGPIHVFYERALAQVKLNPISLQSEM